MGTAEKAALTPPAVAYDTRLRQTRHRTVAHRLREVGYRTGVAGLWHLGTPEPVSSKREQERLQGDASS